MTETTRWQDGHGGEQKLGQAVGEKQMETNSDGHADRWSHWSIYPQDTGKWSGIKRGMWVSWEGGEGFGSLPHHFIMERDTGRVSERVKGERIRQLEIPNNLETVWCQGRREDTHLNAGRPSLRSDRFAAKWEVVFSPLSSSEWTNSFCSFQHAAAILYNGWSRHPKPFKNRLYLFFTKYCSQI